MDTNLSIETLYALIAELDRRYSHILSERDKRYQSEREADQQRVNYAFVAAEKASDRATIVSNEFRGQLADQAATFLRKEEYLSRHIDLERRMETFESRLDTVAARVEHREGDTGGVRQLGTTLLQIVTVVIAAAALAIGLMH